MGRGNVRLFAASGSHDQDGRHAYYYMVKTLQKSSSPEPAGRFSRNNLGMYHRGLQPITVCSNDDPGVTLTYFTARSNFVIRAFLWEKVKTVDFSETIAASDLKLGRSRHLIDFLEVLNVKVISLPWPKVVYIQKLKPDFLRNYYAILNQILYESFLVQGVENLMT